MRVPLLNKDSSLNEDVGTFGMTLVDIEGKQKIYDWSALQNREGDHKTGSEKVSVGR